MGQPVKVRTFCDDRGNVNRTGGTSIVAVAKPTSGRDTLVRSLAEWAVGSRAHRVVCLLFGLWVINFFDWPIERACQYETCFHIVETLVKPERMTKKDKKAREKWWRYCREATEFYVLASGLGRIMVVCQTSKVQLPVLTVTGPVFSHKTVVFPYSDHFH